MRSARLQAQDLTRTNQFVNTLLSKEDLKDLEKPEAPQPPKPPMVNGNGLPFRPDQKPRFSDPPAPPPQQPLPEKPDVPSLKRGPTERPKSGPPPNGSPVRQDNLSQIIQLTEALNSAKRDIDSQTTRMRELEEMLQKERLAREEAEELAKRLEESAHSQMNGSAVPEDDGTVNGVLGSVEETEDVAESQKPEVIEQAGPTVDPAQEMANVLQARIDVMDNQMRDMKEQMEGWKQRCEAAEAERDADRKTLAEMVVQLRAEEAAREEVQRRARSRSRQRRAEAAAAVSDKQMSVTEKTSEVALGKSQSDGASANDESMDAPTLSRANTITPSNQLKGVDGRDHLQASMPFASMLGVVIIGMGLMAYLNGWQTQPPSAER
jgi:hypothetical protein